MYNSNSEEEKILKFWQEDGTFEKSVNERPEGKPYVFYDGPPFATGLPHYGHILSSVIKDVVPRYWTMKGYRVRRRWGWDCHGMPIENIVEKEMKVSGKEQINELGIDKFNEICRSKVLAYTHEWKKMITRIGRWVEFDNSYKTMDQSYMESVWWAVKTIWNKNLIYEGRKVLMYCTRCETPVSKAEVAMDNSYKDVTEESVIVKLKVKKAKKQESKKTINQEIDLPENTYILAWTTTPWTLPGNVALAVGESIKYQVVSIKSENETVILAEDRVEAILKGKDYEVINTVTGADLGGLEYEPLFNMPEVLATGKKAYYVATADFVTTTEGTGVVHTAVIYGEDDFNLGVKIDLPMAPMLNEKGEYNEVAPEFLRGKYIKQAEKEVKKYLEEKGLLFAKAQNTHSYPHCWRCETPLIYNAISAWFINIQKVKNRLLELNEKINWYPEHLKHGRFKNILETAPDWNISRNRYWATPLPFWRHMRNAKAAKVRNDDCENVVCVGSVDELREKGDRKITKIIFVRHGQTDREAKGISSSAVDKHPLNETGVKQVEEAVKQFNQKVDIIISSPVLRCKQTAEVFAKKLGVKVVVDDLITEYHHGSWEEKTLEEKQKDENYIAFKKIASLEEKYKFKLGGAESREEITERVKKFVVKVNKKYSGQTILLCSHGGINAMLSKILHNIDLPQFFIEEDIGDVGEQTFYVDEDGNGLDLHKHNVDNIKLKCDKCGGSMERIPEVIDCWVESASMPFAEWHYPFENVATFKARFPGQYIAEYIAQTRAWFYYMHAMAGLLFDDVSFTNCVTTGNILNEKGEKLSKSKMNYTDPWKIIGEYGVDALRYYLMTSPVMEADDLLFSDREVREVYNKVINILWNVVEFYKLYVGETLDSRLQSLDSEQKKSKVQSPKSNHLLDKWIMSKLHALIKEVTENMDNYNTVKAGRPIKAFIDDLSTWYVRRSRDRFKGENAEDKNAALNTLKEVLLTLAKLMAPFMPFMAERVWQEVKEKGVRKKEKEATSVDVGAQYFVPSVHLQEWPKYKEERHRQTLLDEMDLAKKYVELGLAARAEQKIRVRQPLSALLINKEGLSHELLGIIADELNVKKVEFAEYAEGKEWVKKEDGKTAVWLNITIDEQLKKEGLLREVIRTINQIRKEQKLTIKDLVSVSYSTTDKELGSVFAEMHDEIKQAVLAKEIKQQKGAGAEVMVDGKPVSLLVSKIS